MIGAMMKQSIRICLIQVLWAMAGVLLLSAGGAAMAETKAQKDVSGKLEKGFRVLLLDDSQLAFVVYRGDYVKFDVEKHRPGSILSIPSLSVEEPLTADFANAPYIKMKEVGVFDFFVGAVSGTLTVKEYRGNHYRAVTSHEAQGVIQVFDPLILDVRTPREYKKSHLENSKLIPVQELQRRFGELSNYKDEPILVYCATGNRSTVASKILIDQGFTRIFNLRYGIADWSGNKYPIVK